MPKGPKDTDKVKIAQIEPSGDVSPAYPPNPGPNPPGEAEKPLHEPVFTMSREEGHTGELRFETSEPHLEKAINSLKEKVKDISNTPDLTNDQTDILKKYIALKEAEVRDLKDQQRQYQSYLKKLSGDYQAMSLRNHDLLTQFEALRRKEEALRSELSTAKQHFTEQLASVKNEFSEKLKKSGDYEAQVDDLMHKREEWRDKIKEDLKRIKLKERELENKYELLKRDMQALLDSKDRHTLELKKKNDALELEMESLEERLRKANSILGTVSSKKRRLVETMRLALSLLESLDEEEAAPETDRKKAG